MITRRPGTEIRALGDRQHSHCVVCGARNEHGLGVSFHVTETGRVESRFECDEVFAGFPQMVHGGVIASLLDGAMLHCLFAEGKVAVTAELTIRYREPVATKRPATVRAWLERSTSKLHRLGAELEQDGRVKATGSAKFMARSEAMPLAGMAG